MRLLFGVALAIMLIAIAMAGAPVLAKGQLDIVARFLDASLELDVATYVDPEADPATDRVGMLGFASGAVRNSFALSADDWGTLLALWTKSVKSRSRNWHTVGTIVEKGAADASKLTLSAGPSVKIAITSTNGASASYTLAKIDIPRFEAALTQVREILKRANSE